MGQTAERLDCIRPAIGHDAALLNADRHPRQALGPILEPCPPATCHSQPPSSYDRRMREPRGDANLTAKRLLTAKGLLGAKACWVRRLARREGLLGVKVWGTRQ